MKKQPEVTFNQMETFIQEMAIRIEDLNVVISYMKDEMIKMHNKLNDLKEMNNACKTLKMD